MKLDLFIQKSSNLFGENRLLKFIIIVIGITTVFNTFLLTSISQKEKIILIPPTLGSDLFVTGNNASDEYIRGITRYIMSLYLNYSAVSVKGQIEDLMAIYEPRAFAQVEGKFAQFVNDILRSRISSSYYIINVSINRTKKIIMIDGLRKQFMHEREVMSEKEKYQINYKIDDSRFRIKNILRRQA